MDTHTSPDRGPRPPRGAVLSECGLYRYSLWRSLGPCLFGADRTVNFVILNPSTANANVDDPTVRRCLGFARSWGYGRLIITNLFAWRATDPDALKKASDPVGPENDAYLADAGMASDLVVCAWGAGGGLTGRDQQVLDLFRSLGLTPHAIRLTKDGRPCHPLYLPADLIPFTFT